MTTRPARRARPRRASTGAIDLGARRRSSTSPWTQTPGATSRAPGAGGAPSRPASTSACACEVLLGRADVEPVAVGREAEEPARLRQHARERLALDRHVRAAAGMRSRNDGSSTYVPALIQLLGALPGGGFSTNAITSPSAARRARRRTRSGPRPAVSEIVASAPRSSWKRTIAPRSRSVSTSPLQTTKRSSMPSAAKRIAPAVPSGSSSTA